jgi:hypothetical protein
MSYFGSSERVRQALLASWGRGPCVAPLARAEQERYRAIMAAAMRETGLPALAAVPFFPWRLEAAVKPGYPALTSPENLAGFPRWRCRCRPGSSCSPVCSSSADRTQKRCCLPPGSNYQAVYPAASHVEQASLVGDDDELHPLPRLQPGWSRPLGHAARADVS